MVFFIAVSSFVGQWLANKLTTRSGQAEIKLAVLSFFSDTTYRNHMDLREWARSRRSRRCILDLIDVNTSVTPEYTRCCMRKVSREMPYALTGLDALWLKQHKFSKHFVSILPEHDLPHHSTCAVVSNAPSMRELGDDVAREIDESDAVFRINQGPVIDFEKYVGYKETYRVLNIHDGVIKCRAIENNLRSGNSALFIREELHRRELPSNVSHTWDFKRPSIRRGPLKEYQRMHNKYPVSRVMFNHPVFGDFSVDSLHTGLFGPTEHPLSTGTQALLLATMICDKVVSYEIASETPLSKTYKYYYRNFSRVEPYSWWHPLEAEIKLQKFLSTNRRDGTSIYEFDMAASDNDLC